MRLGKYVMSVAMAAAVTVVASSVAALAAQPLRIIVPYPAGSGTDVVARIVGNELSNLIARPVVVENIVGASGLIATRTVQNAEPDGNTILLTAANHVLMPTTQADLPFDVVDDFTAITLVCTGPLVMAANPDFPGRSIPELIEMARAEPGGIFYASAGIGTAPHMAVELLAQMADIELVHIPYSGGSTAMADVVAGEVPFYFSTVASALSFFDSGLAVPVAVTTAERPSFYSEVPTIAEEGLDGYHVEFWYGILGPRGLDEDFVADLSEKIAEVLDDPNVIDAINKQGFSPSVVSGAEFEQFLRSEVSQWREVAQRAGIEAN